jgi:DNA repair protein RecN (Recombination protein N)
MLRRLSLRDFVIVTELNVELELGFSVLTGETGAGKSILIDALQLTLGGRGDAGVVREGAQRTDIAAEWDTPPSLNAWLIESGFENLDESAEPSKSLLLRRSIDAQGRSRAWINGNSATLTQLREIADHLVDIHGQHAWQSLTRAASVRDLLDAYAGIDSNELSSCYQRWKQALEALSTAQNRQASLLSERERLTWQITELEKLAPQEDEWARLDADHRRHANAQALMDAAQTALNLCTEADESASNLTNRALEALSSVASFDGQLAGVVEVLESAQAQLQDASRSLSGFLNHADLDPQTLQALDERMGAWMGLARRYRRPPPDLPALLSQWQIELQSLDAACDSEALQATLDASRKAFDTQAQQVSAARHKAAPRLAEAVTHAMQQLGMAGGRFDVALLQQDEPQSFGLESAEFLVAGHAGSTPKPLGKVASGGELSRIALAIAVTTSQLGEAATLMFDEVDSGVGGAVAETVGRLMKQLGVDRTCRRWQRVLIIISRSANTSKLTA